MEADIFTEVMTRPGLEAPTFYGSSGTDVMRGSAAIFTEVVFCMGSEAAFLRKRKHSTVYYYNV